MDDGSACFRWPTGSGIKSVNLALQGGGALGAFTWGVLDAVLGDERLTIEGISGTSAGAVNAAVLAAGVTRGGREGARLGLRNFWKSIARQSALSPIQRTALDVLSGGWSLDYNPMLTTLDVMSRLVSPYEFNPMNWNPLLDLIREAVDFDAVHECDCVKLFISATNVHTGTARVFTGPEVTPEVIMASACLPYLFQAVEIDGEPYWDGGYMGNPVLAPFFKSCETPDIIIVQVNPISRRATPRTARQIQDRVNEISFNAPLIRELRHVMFVNECLQRSELSGMGYREVYLHRIGGCEELEGLPASTKFNAEWAFFKHLRDIGRRSAREWLSRHFTDLGSRATINVNGSGDTLRVEDSSELAVSS